MSSLKEKGKEGRIQDPAAAWGCPTGKEQPDSSGTHSKKDKGEQVQDAAREKLFTLRMIQPCTWHPKKMRNVQ